MDTFRSYKQWLLIGSNYRTGFYRHINGVQAWCIINGYDVEGSLHFFRHSLATNLAENGFDDLELFDWSIGSLCRRLRGIPREQELRELIGSQGQTCEADRLWI